MVFNIFLLRETPISRPLPRSNPIAIPHSSPKRATWDGGESGIRTHDNLAAILVFETSALDQLCDLSVIVAVPFLSPFGGQPPRQRRACLASLRDDIEQSYFTSFPTEIPYSLAQPALTSNT